ncbi:tyrosine-protein phosphatase [Pseudoruegeria sp. SK021]|uniref:fused DSP-PTPase phosphatase/NAD kinase-like protein n=1 Tax=Pseudoruegeria sp. SK021 TaxID=1933035 RepID=UPI000A241EC3|nr:tyrosine-protein phosphatase [Pseudoruegeria sp. SK021]OSP56180.1 hypothetical protein BV911_04420 [Pseudoruegeria sp. SK021]
MAFSLKSQFTKMERGLRKRFGRDISTPKTRRHAWWHFQILDHAFLRVWWWNLEEIAPGVWRSNQPSQARIKRYREMGIRTIINLRGKRKHSPYLFEEEACAKEGLILEDITLSARSLASRKDLLGLIEIMRNAEKPMLLHCKSGADRAGFASALYLAIVEGRPLPEARKHLHWRYLHLPGGDTDILDHVLDSYEAETAQEPMSLEAWITTRYDAARLTESWKATRK